MQLFRSVNKLQAIISNGAVVTIGNYDGVHLGHQEILQQVKSKSQELHLPSVVIIFEPQPEEFFTSSPDYARLTSLREKLQLFAAQKIDYVLCLRFNPKLAVMPANDFVQTILVDAVKVRYLVVGDDFVFGRKREGNLRLLQAFAARYDFVVEQMPSYKIHGMRVSSTLIRAALQTGDLPITTTLLGRPYTFLGRVVHGDKIGRNLGFPTANIYLPHKFLPLSGVYAVKIYGIDKVELYGVANIGFRPTIGDTKKSLEVFIFNFADEIYGKRIAVEFVKKIRDEIKFASFELLREQISADVLQAKQYFKVNS